MTDIIDARASLQHSQRRKSQGNRSMAMFKCLCFNLIPRSSSHLPQVRELHGRVAPDAREHLGGAEPVSLFAVALAWSLCERSPG